MTKENIYYMDDNAFDRFYKRARYQANSFVAGKFGSKAADYLTTLPDFAYLVCKLMLDPDVPSSRKLDLGLALLYVLSPLDFVPDSFPLLGKIDDAYAILVSVAKLLRSTDRNIILRHWLGDPETIDTVRAWLNYFDEKFGSGLMKKIAGMASATNHFAKRVPASSVFSSRDVRSRAAACAAIRSSTGATAPPNRC